MKSFAGIVAKVAVIATLLASAVGAVAQPKDLEKISAAEKKQTLERLEFLLTRAAFVPGVDFKKWPDMVTTHQSAIDQAETVGDFTRTVNQVMESYGFSHIVLFSPEQGASRETQSRAGIGIRIEIEPDGLRVVNIFPGSPASEIGLQPGDLVFECDGHPVKGVADLAGSEGQKSTIKYKRENRVVTVDVTRRKYSTVLPESLTWQGDTAILTVPSFDAGYNRDRVEELMAEIDKRAKAVVLDLRGNGGGRVINLQHLASFFLDKDSQPLGTFVGRQEVANYSRRFGPSVDPVQIAEKTDSKVRATRNSKGILLKVPVSCLIDGGSGSASEMMAGALRDNLGAKLYGRKSAGAVLASMIVPMGDDLGFWLQFPVTDYVTIKGLRIEGHPLVPDKEFPIAKFGEPDGALQAAVANTIKTSRM
ncbi:MAG: PDZ domain-containing protein [Armatimonadetes bacterium]|nr:PDZ domain-containing protein [Armatimonadota bacterium]MBS1711600.1 PDZ domain-containing protein [Armatimonadota bacterium]MBX3109845.1 PDZ domain-containing protein [Fimbriimonadaceae bacterium]